jgi:hypothetical protein
MRKHDPTHAGCVPIRGTNAVILGLTGVVKTRPLRIREQRWGAGLKSLS